MTLSTFTQHLVDVGQVAAIIGLAIFSIWAAFFKGKNKLHSEVDADGDRLINILKGTVEQLEIRVQTLEANNTKLEKKLEEVKTENKSLRDVLQGRDAIQVEYQKRVLDTLISLEEGNSETLESIRSLYELMNKHLTVQPQHSVA